MQDIYFRCNTIGNLQNVGLIAYESLNIFRTYIDSPVREESIIYLRAPNMCT